MAMMGLMRKCSALVQKEATLQPIVHKLHLSTSIIIWCTVVYLVYLVVCLAMFLVYLYHDRVHLTTIIIITVSNVEKGSHET